MTRTRRTLIYPELRTGHEYGTVAAGLREEARRVFLGEGRRMFITRRTILGRWHEIKRNAWRAYKDVAADAALARQELEEELEARAAEYDSTFLDGLPAHAEPIGVAWGPGDPF